MGCHNIHHLPNVHPSLHLLGRRRNPEVSRTMEMSERQRPTTPAGHHNNSHDDTPRFHQQHDAAATLPGREKRRRTAPAEDTSAGDAAISAQLLSGAHARLFNKMFAHKQQLTYKQPRHGNCRYRSGMPLNESEGWSGMLPRARGLLSRSRSTCHSKRRRSCTASQSAAKMYDAAILAAAATEPGLTCDTLHAISRLLEQAGAFALSSLVAVHVTCAYCPSLAHHTPKCMIM